MLLLPVFALMLHLPDVAAACYTCTYAYAGYFNCDVLQVPYHHHLGHEYLSAAQTAFNRDMSAVRIAVEWCFKEICYTWKLLQFKSQLRIGSSPVALLYIVATDLTNLRYVAPVNARCK